MTLTRSTVTGNSANGGVGGLTVHDGGTLHITRSRITRNSASLGSVGGLFVGGTGTITQSTIAGNRASNTGGILIGFKGVALLVNSAVVDNGGGEIGGIQNSGLLLLTNSTVARNDSGGGGGGLVNAGTAVLLNATITDNGDNSDSPRGITVNSGTVTLQNTIVARNDVDCDVTAPGRIISLGTNFIGDPEHCPITLHATDRTSDPGLDAFRDNGRPGQAHFPLQPTSQAIDAGNDAVCPRTDQLGQSRRNIPEVGMSLCDMGAIEFQQRDTRQPDEEEDEPDADPAAGAQESS